MVEASLNTFGNVLRRPNEGNRIERREGFLVIVRHKVDERHFEVFRRIEELNVLIEESGPVLIRLGLLCLGRDSIEFVSEARSGIVDVITDLPIYLRGRTDVLKFTIAGFEERSDVPHCPGVFYLPRSGRFYVLFSHS